MAQFVKKHYKSIINKMKYIDSWFWARYTINPYNGCQFGCIYCDARSAKYHMPEDFENRIVIKTQVGPMLENRLANARTFQPDVVVIGGVTDAYQPAEKKYENTRRLLEVLHEHQYPVHIITKSTLVQRDLDLLESIAQQNWATISFTVTTIDPSISAFVDYRAPAPVKRLAALEEIKKRAPSVQSGVLLIPLVPVFCDSSDSLREFVTAAKSAGADYLLFGSGMTLRDVQAGWFLDKLQTNYPAVYQAYQQLYGFTRHDPEYDGRYLPKASYLAEKNSLLRNLCEEHNMHFRIPRFIPRDWRATNYQISEKMLNRSFANQIAGQDWKNLFWAGQNIQNLHEPIEAVASRGELDSIPNVRGLIKERIEELISL